MIFMGFSVARIFVELQASQSKRGWVENYRQKVAGPPYSLFTASNNTSPVPLKVNAEDDLP
jgi:hypothetical protein